MASRTFSALTTVLSYRNQQMELLAARIGSSVHYREPFTPTSKSKIERWFLTMRLQYLATLDMNMFDSIDAIRKDFDAYILRYNKAVHSSLNVPSGTLFLRTKKNPQTFGIRCSPQFHDGELDRGMLCKLCKYPEVDIAELVKYVED